MTKHGRPLGRSWIPALILLASAAGARAEPAPAEPHPKPAAPTVAHQALTAKPVGPVTAPGRKLPVVRLGQSIKLPPPMSSPLMGTGLVPETAPPASAPAPASAAVR